MISSLVSSEQEILEDFPELTSEDIKACLPFAAERERRLVSAARRLHAVQEISKAINSSLDLGQTLQTIIAETHRLMPFERAAVMLRERNSLRMVAASDEGRHPTKLVGQVFPLKGSAGGRIPGHDVHDESCQACHRLPVTWLNMGSLPENDQLAGTKKGKADLRSSAFPIDDSTSSRTAIHCGKNGIDRR